MSPQARAISLLLVAQAGCHDRDAPASPRGGVPTVEIASEPPPERSAPPSPSTTAAPGALPPAPPRLAPLARPWLSLTREDLEHAVQRAGYRVDHFSESQADNGRLLRILKVSRGSFQGSVAWYKTDDIEGVRKSFAKDWPQRVDGVVLLVVKSVDPGGRAEAEALMETLAGP